MCTPAGLCELTALSDLLVARTAQVVKHAESMTFELFNAQGEKVLALKADTERVRYKQ